MKVGGTRWTLPAGILVILGLGRMAAELVGLSAVSGLAGATMLAPAPKVFSEVKGLETYSTRFLLEWTDHGGVIRRVELDSERYAGLRGPYQRRNVYGAALAYGPVLAADERGAAMLESVLRYALSGDAPLLAELGIDAREIDGRVAIVYEPLPGTDMGELATRLEAPGAVGQ